MTYGQWHATFTDKVAAYDWYTCRRALEDCHATLALHKDLSTDDAYYIKLWAEIDALRERQLVLQGIWDKTRKLLLSKKPGGYTKADGTILTY